MLFLILILILLLIVIISLLWFDFYFYYKNEKKFRNDFKEARIKADTIIIFNAGGFGTINYKKAFDLNPIIEQVKKYLNKKGYKVSIITYNRTEDHIIGKIGYLKDYLYNFPKESEQLSSILRLSDKKIILIGLSNGASFADATMHRLKKNKNIYSIEFGKPFFATNSNNKNILLINNKKDHISNGDTFKLITVFMLAPYRWLKNFILGERIPVGLAMKIDGHDYRWKDNKEKIIDFINKHYEIKE